MTLEPVIPELNDQENPELVDFNRRFWWTLPFSMTVMVLAMAGHSVHWFAPRTQTWIEFALSLPVAASSARWRQPGGAACCASMWPAWWRLEPFAWAW